MTETTQIQQLLAEMHIPESEQEDLQRISKIRKINKDEFFVTEGQVPKNFGIVISGLFRYYYVNDKGDEFTKGFILKGNVLAAYSAMLYQETSLFSVQALEDAAILEINYKQWQTLQRNNTFWDKFLIVLLQKGYCVKEKRERELLLLDAETRYKIFLEEFPSLDKRIKLQIIASYLGIKPESLSRIRKNMPG